MDLLQKTQTEEAIRGLIRLLAQELAPLVAQELRKSQPKMQESGETWPEVMDLETAGRYMDRGPEGIRNFVRKRLLPRVAIDSKIQIRKCDLDKLAKDNLI